MASIRRTLSPVPRAGAIRNGETQTHSLPSPLSKSSHTQAHFHSTLLTSVDSHPFLYKLQTALLGVFCKRSSRSSDRSKPKGTLWRKSFWLHLVICFLLGVFIGFTPFVPKDFTVNVVSKNQALSFESIQSAGDGHQHDIIISSVNVPPLLASPISGNSTISVMEGEKEEVIDVIPDEIPSPKPLKQEAMFSSHSFLIVVTPTYARPFQAYYLHRLAHTLRLVPPPLLWIVVEMSAQSTETADILRRTGVMYRHLVCDKNLTGIRDRYVHQRNVALSHIETHRLDGIVYFADDNNMYSVDLFEHIREIRRFGTWPVAMLTENKKEAIIEGPVCSGSEVNGWHTNDKRARLQRFHAHMSGFAFNSTILWDPKRWHRPTLDHIRQHDKGKEGFQGSTFIEQVVEDETQMEGLGNCSVVMVWHLQLEASHPFYPRKWLMKNNLDMIAPMI